MKNEIGVLTCLFLDNLSNHKSSFKALLDVRLAPWLISISKHLTYTRRIKDEFAIQSNDALRTAAVQNTRHFNFFGNIIIPYHIECIIWWKSVLPIIVIKTKSRLYSQYSLQQIAVIEHTA